MVFPIFPKVPKIKHNQVLIKVEAASYNYDDLWGIWGEPIKIPLPHISGSDVSGTVVDVEENVLNIKIGDRIVRHSTLTCRICKECTSGKEYDCRHRQVYSFPEVHSLHILQVKVECPTILSPILISKTFSPTSTTVPETSLPEM